LFVRKKETDSNLHTSAITFLLLTRKQGEKFVHATLKGYYYIIKMCEE